MAFYLDMIKGFCARMQERVEVARKVAGKPFMLAEKIQYFNLWEVPTTQVYVRTESFVDFAPFCVAG